jgi:hypothetical protein
MPSLSLSAGWPHRPDDLLDRIPSALRESQLDRVWRDGAAVAVEPRLAVALPGGVFPVLGDYDELRGRDPGSFTAAEQSGATFTIWEVAADWFTPPLLPRQSGGLGVGRAGATLVCDARVVTPDVAARFLTAATAS